MPGLSVGNDGLITLTGWKDRATDTYLNEGAGTFALYTLLDEVWTAVVGATGEMEYIAASDGIYQGQLDYALFSSVITFGTRYGIEVRLEQDEIDAQFEFVAMFSRRGRF